MPTPHPGNYIFSDDGTVAVIDFGCVKEITEDFYTEVIFEFMIIILPLIHRNSRSGCMTCHF